MCPSPLAQVGGRLRTAAPAECAAVPVLATLCRSPSRPQPQEDGGALVQLGPWDCPCARVRAHVRLSLKACSSGPRGRLSISGEIFGCPNLGMPLTPCNVQVCPRQYGII